MSKKKKIQSNTEQFLVKFNYKHIDDDFWDRASETFEVEQETKGVNAKTDAVIKSALAVRYGENFNIVRISFC